MNVKAVSTGNVNSGALPCTDTEKFLRALVPSGNAVISILRPDGTMGHKYFDNHPDAAAFTANADSQGLAVYHACAGYGPRENGRTADNVVSVKALWLDVDVGPDKPYTKKSTAGAAVRYFTRALGMPQPMLVDSGYGLHAYWPLAEAVTAAEWLPVARALKAATVAMGLQADPKRTADVASILRPPGTHNRKDPADPKPVKVVWPGAAPELLTHYHKILDVEPDPLGAPPAYAMVSIDLNTDFSAGDTGRQDQAQVEDVLAVCQQLRTMRDAPETQGYAAWYGTLGLLAFCEGGDERAHEWGAGHPDYRHAQTQKFLDNWRNMSGGATCARFKQDNPAGCAGCTFAGKSPLGAPRQHSATPSATSAETVALDYDRFDISAGWGNIPKRQWLMGTILVRGEYTILTSPGGRGKSSLSIGLALSAAKGEDLLGQLVTSPLRVGVTNFEDSRDEVMRRCMAFAQHHKIARADLEGRVKVFGMDELVNVKLNKFEGNRPFVDKEGIASLKKIVSECRLDVLVLDPLGSLCPAGLNDNAVMSSVMSELKRMASECRCAVLIVHHTRKGSSYGGVASAEDASGAAAITNHARIALSIEHFDDDEARSFGILPSDKWQYIKLQNTKANMAVRGEPTRYTLSSVSLPSGDDVQAIALFLPKLTTLTFTDPCLRDVLCCIALGHMKRPLSSSKQASQRGYRPPVAKVLRTYFPNESGKTFSDLADDAISVATTRGWLTTATPPGHRKGTQPALVVVWSATPWAAEPAPGAFVQ